MSLNIIPTILMIPMSVSFIITEDYCSSNRISFMCKACTIIRLTSLIGSMTLLFNLTYYLTNSKGLVVRAIILRATGRVLYAASLTKKNLWKWGGGENGKTPLFTERIAWNFACPRGSIPNETVGAIFRL